MSAFQPTSISQALALHAETFPNKIYLIADEEKYSYAEMDNLVNSACHFFKELRLQKGDVISAIIRNGSEYIVLYLASLRYGTIFNPYPFTLESNDIMRYLENVNPSVVICQKRHFGEISENFRTELIEEDFTLKLDTRAQRFQDFVPDPKDPACIYYSSGTTGNPKGIVFSHNNMMANISSIIRGFKHKSEDVHLIVLPLGHTASINYSFLPATLAGSSIVLQESFWKARPKFWKLVNQHRVTYTELVPSILIGLLNTPYLQEDLDANTSLEYVGCGSSTLSQELQTEFFNKFGLKAGNLYGLSETGPTHVDDPRNDDWKPGSVGKALDVNEIGIMDEQNSLLAVEEQGEIVVKGENVFIDYYNNRKLYDEVVIDDWFHTGDLGYLDEEGRLYFIGRKKDLIIKGGVNISPEEIDEVLYKIPEIKEALTIGVPDPFLGEKIVAYLVLKENKEIEEQALRAFCSDYLSRDKIPNEFRFVDSIPKGHSGKFLRRELRKRESNA